MEIDIDRAMAFGAKCHEGQKDDDGHDYFWAHPVQVFYFLKEIAEDETVLIAALLHDVLEDTETTPLEIEKEFGKKVAELVLEVTHEEKKDEVGYYFPRLKSKDAILIKFADRLSNLSRMSSWNQKRQDQYLRKSKFWKSEGRSMKKQYTKEELAIKRIIDKQAQIKGCKIRIKDLEKERDVDRYVNERRELSIRALKTDIERIDGAIGFIFDFFDISEEDLKDGGGGA